ncbi:MAG: NTP transferase domain-containing protein [Ramlibacter sp.]
MTQPTVIVLASGRGERFIASGGGTHKLQALLGGRPVLERTLDAVRASGLPWHLEDRGHDGMGDSIAAGVAAARDAPGWLILPGDLPLIQAQTLRAVAAALARTAVVVPSHGGVRGHPVGFGPECRDELLQLRGPEGASGIVRARTALGQIVLLELGDAGIVADIDTTADLARAEALLLASRST